MTAAVARRWSSMCFCISSQSPIRSGRAGSAPPARASWASARLIAASCRLDSASPRISCTPSCGSCVNCARISDTIQRLPFRPKAAARCSTALSSSMVNRISTRRRACPMNGRGSPGKNALDPPFPSSRIAIAINWRTPSPAVKPRRAHHSSQRNLSSPSSTHKRSRTTTIHLNGTVTRERVRLASGRSRARVFGPELNACDDPDPMARSDRRPSVPEPECLHARTPPT
ncbi:hypothetical protein BamIOP4010DRAFT_2279 [Burkholderia ambifaria IOP40-10]|uniref:Uncharacterized protein n=1 Tax=Burkholderia ambifaria IOP40-10 TaxID=396596 RepID=B1FE19_9BURK|nr:hypothetical protein BamIOP4010DRAFT_2279 [Burkholderia ambifaria IOP40-10]